jgi:hypothetical protein
MPPSSLDFDSRPKRSSVVLAAIATFVVLGGTFATLLFESIRTPQPDRVFIVRANSDWQDVELIVKGGPLKEPNSVVMDKLGGYTIPFFLWQGKYTLQVISQGVQVYSQDIDLTDPKVQTLDLLQTGATTRPSTNPSMQKPTA